MTGQIDANSSIAVTKPRLLIIFLDYAQTYPGALKRLTSLVERLDLPKRLIIVHNERSEESAHPLNEWIFETSGDNSAYEFTGWQKALNSDLAKSFKADVLLFVNSSFITHSFYSMPLIDADIVRIFAERRLLGGHIRRVGYPVMYHGLDLSEWVITHFFLANSGVISELGGVVSETSADKFLMPNFQSKCLTKDDLWDGPMKEYLWTGLTRKYRDVGKELTAESYGFFRRKILSVINEIVLSSRARQQGCELVDLTPFPRLLNRPTVWSVAGTEIRPYRFLRKIVLNTIAMVLGGAGKPEPESAGHRWLSAICCNGIRRGLTEPPMDVPRVALFSATGLGDIISLGPLLRKIKELYPRSLVTIYSQTAGPCAGMELDYVDHMVVYNAISIVPKLVGAPYDLLIAWGVQAKIHSRHSRLLYRLLIAMFPARKKLIYGNLDAASLKGNNIIEIKLNILRKLNCRIAPRDYALNLPFSIETAQKKVAGLLQAGEIDGSHRLVVLHIGAKPGHTSRLWPTERWIKLLTLLHRNYGAAVIFIGTNDESIATSRVIGNLDFTVLNLVGKLSLTETAAVIDAASLVISTNSGPMWLAAALKKPQVTLCGPSKFEWEPYNEKAIVVRRPINRKHCLPPCDHKICHYKDNLCMNEISVDDVSRAIESINCLD